MSSLVAQMGGLGELCSLRKLTLIPGIALEGIMDTPVFLPGKSQGWGSLVGCRLWGRTESDTTEVT